MDIDTILKVVPVSAFVALLIYWLNRRHHTSVERRRAVQPLVQVLRSALQALIARAKSGLIYPGDLAEIKKVLKDHETTESYAALPGTIIQDLNAAIPAVEDFMRLCRQVREGLYAYFESVPNKRNDPNLRRVVATAIVCGEESDIPKEARVVSFPRDSRNAFSEAKFDLETMHNMWVHARDTLPLSNYRDSRADVVYRLECLDAGLRRLQEIG